MKVNFGQILLKAFSFFEKIGGFFLRSTSLKILLLMFILAVAWQLGTMSTTLIGATAGVSCDPGDHGLCKSELNDPGARCDNGTCVGGSGGGGGGTGGEAGECVTGTVERGACDCNSKDPTACYPVQWTRSCDNGKWFSYNERVISGECAGACAGESACSGARTGASCGSTPDGGTIRKDGCVWDGAHNQCVMKVIGCTNGKENPYTVYEAGCEGQCGSNIPAARTAEQICREKGGVPDGTCTDNGQACRFGPAGSAKQCCYGDESAAKRNGACYQGSTGAVDCSGNTITNKSGHDITVLRFSGGNSCPMRNQTGGSFVLKNSQSVDATCEQLDAPGFCGVCNADCGEKTPPPPPPPPPPGKHKECINFACKLVDGAGSDKCSSDKDCKVEKHKECVDEACKLVPGPGANKCATDKECTKVTQAVVCDQLTASPTFGNIPLTVDFKLSGHTTGGGSVQKYRFDFGDTTATGDQTSSNTSHTYNSAGTFTARGYVTDNLGNVAGGSPACIVTISTSDRPTYKHKVCDNNACVERDCPDKYVSCGSTCGKNDDCKAGNQYSVCDSISVSPNSSNTVPLTVTSTLSGHTVNGGSITNYRFNFGDNTGDVNQSGNSVQHTYNAKGTYYINGYVIDNNGNVSGGCQTAVNIYQPQILGTYTPPTVMPKTGPETDALIALASFAGAGMLLRKFKPSWKFPKFR